MFHTEETGINITISTQKFLKLSCFSHIQQHSVLYCVLRFSAASAYIFIVNGLKCTTQKKHILVNFAVFLGGTAESNNAVYSDR